MPLLRTCSILIAAGAVLSGSGTLPRAEEFECLVEPYLEVKINSAVPGILDEVKVDRGARVEKGQVVAALRSDVEKASWDLAKARAAFAARKVERNKELYRKQMISINEKDEMETELEVLKLEAREAEERLKLRTIVSPIQGVVVKRHRSAGEFVDLDDEPILELAQIDPLRVEAVVPFKLWGQIKVGSTAQVTWEAPIKGAYPATVKVVDAVVDAASGTIGVRLELPNPKHQLPAGTKCTARFTNLGSEATGGQ